MANKGFEPAHYSVRVVGRDDKKKYDITDLITGLDLEEDYKGIAQKATITIKQNNFEKRYATSITNVCDRIYIYASDGGAAEEVFRGYIWNDRYEKENDDRPITITAFDNLIYLQESEESRFFKKGKKTVDIFKDLCSKHGIKLDYTYTSITHEQLAIRGKLSDVFLDDLIEEARKKTGKRGVVRYDKGTMYVFEEGKKNRNGVIYKLTRGAGGNIIKSTHEYSMDDVVTKVTIVSTQSKGADKVQATVKGATDKYGTINKIVTKSSNEKLDKLKTEAKQYIEDYGHPQKTIGLVCIDNPWIRKGDKVYFDDGYEQGYAFVTYVKHEADKKTMSLELRKKEEKKEEKSKTDEK